MTKDKDQARKDRKMEIEGTLLGIYMRNNQMRDLPIDKKTVDEIIDNIAPFYITMSQYDFGVLKDAVKVATKSPDMTTEQKKTLRMLFKKIELFNKA
jgi:hypothetical protein